MVSTNMKKRGGKRPGAGRPKTSTRIKKSLTLEKELIDWASQQPEKLSVLIEKGLRLLMKNN